MSEKYEPVPISAAKELARRFKKNQVIVVTWDAKHSRTHVTTFGASIEECDQAAQGGDRVKRALGGPESLRGVEPSRVRQLRRQLDEAKLKHRDDAKQIVDLLSETRDLRRQLDEANVTIADLRRRRDALLDERGDMATEHPREVERLRAEVEELRQLNEMACVEPADDCGCSGCTYADEVYGANKKGNDEQE